MKFTAVKGFFSKLGKTIAHPFSMLINKIRSSKLTTLVLMQLKDKWNFSFKANKKASIFKIITYLVIFAAITALSYFIMSILVKTLNIFVSPKFPITAMNLVIVVLTLFEGFSILIGLTRTLYFGKDNAVLITYPVKADYLFVSKIIVYLFDAIKNAFTLFVPVLFAYGILNGMPVGFFFWMPFSVIVFMIVVVLICALLSIPTYFVMRFFKKFVVIKVILTFVILAGLVFAAIAVIRVIPDNINLIRTFEKFSTGLNNFLNEFKNALKGMYWVTICLCGESKGYAYSLFTSTTGYVMLAFVGSIVILSFLNFKLSKPFYNRMISAKPNQDHIRHKVGKNRKTGKFLSSVKYEFIRIIRSEKTIITTLLCIVVTPLFMLLVNKIYIAFSTRHIGDVMIVCFNLFIILAFTFSNNVSTSCIYSKDGPSWNTNKTMPYEPRAALLSRLVYNTVTSVFIFVPSLIILFNTGKLIKGDFIILLVLCLILSILHILFSANFDYMHSKNKTIASIGREYVTKHEAVSVVFALLVAFVAAGLLLLMGVTSTPNMYLRLLAIAIVVLALEIYIFLKKIYATYQEN